MKKAAALLLALILALTAIPALGEDYSGLWYLNFYYKGEVLESSDAYKVYTDDVIVTVETLELKADGSVTALDSGAAGTWEATDTGIVLTLQDQPVQLTLTEAGLANAEQNVLLTREASLLTIGLIQDYATAAMAGETIDLPEGLTEDDVANALATLYSGE